MRGGLACRPEVADLKFRATVDEQQAKRVINIYLCTSFSLFVSIISFSFNVAVSPEDNCAIYNFILLLLL